MTRGLWARWIIALVAMVAAGAVRPVAAQTLILPQPDTRVRVELTNGRMLAGRVTSTSADSLHLFADDADSTVAIAAPFIRAYQYSAGKDRRRGAKRGAIITGAISLAAIAVAAYGDVHTQDAGIPASLFVVPLGVALTATGTGLGALSAPDKWMPRVTAATGVSARHAGALRVGLRLRF